VSVCIGCNCYNRGKSGVKVSVHRHEQKQSGTRSNDISRKQRGARVSVCNGHGLYNRGNNLSVAHFSVQRHGQKHQERGMAGL